MKIKWQESYHAGYNAWRHAHPKTVKALIKEWLRHGRPACTVDNYPTGEQRVAMWTVMTYAKGIDRKGGPRTIVLMGIYKSNGPKLAEISFEEIRKVEK